ncbi:aminopeptidase N-like [Branchiostoma floridae]|uniref:Aminopeptidase n=1 Tax=Branchiostoma floridae TaxID=7739 RepID=A0A9J7LBE9_BRAFL|nr:aminopeptidase N-like [Branchiostoma floridae]
MSGILKRYSMRSGKVHDESCTWDKCGVKVVFAVCVTLLCIGLILIIVFETQRAGPAPKPWKQFRLPDTLIPVHYDVEVQADLTTFDLIGRVDISVRCATPTSYVILHSSEQEIDRNSAPTVRGSDGRNAPTVTSWFLFPENEFLVLELSENLKEGELYIVTINFNGAVRAALNGFYRSSYVNEQGQTRYLGITDFQPQDARKAYPCFDEPAFKATFNVTVVHQPEYTALSNMPRESTEIRGGGWVADKFQKMIRMPTYLLAFGVSDFDSIGSNTSTGIETRIWARPEYIAAGMGDFGLDVANRVVVYFEDYFGVPFPLPKIDHIALPDFNSGAMENWGLITYRETRLLYDTNAPSAEVRKATARIIAHELAHMWFGNLVTMEWWDGTWLNEGFASYIQYKGLDFVDPGMNVMEHFAYDRSQSVMVDDSLTSSNPVYRPITTADDVTQVFGSIIYSKGASILRMLENFIGEETFKKALKNYLSKNAYGNAVQDQLWAELTTAAREDGQTDLDVKAVMDTWTVQMGYPVVNMTRDYTRGTAEVAQQHFLVDSAATVSVPSELGYRWYIPLTYLTQANLANSPVQTWMAPDEGTKVITLQGASANEFVLANINHAGFYRVNYDPTNWQLLADHLNSDAFEDIPADNRGTLVDDAFNLARAGMLDLTTAMSMTQYLVRDRHFIPWSMALRATGYIENVVGSVTEISNLWQPYMRQLISPFYEDVGWTLQEGDYNTEVGQVEALSTACKYGNGRCVNNATMMFDQWMNTNNNSHIPERLKSTVYCTAIKHGGNLEWDFAWQEYLSAEASEQTLLISALACTQDIDILNTYLERSQDDSLVRRQNGPLVVRYIGRNSVGKSVAWSFLRDNWDFYFDTYDGTSFTMTGIVEDVTSQFSTQEDLDELETFLAAHPNQGTATQAFSQAVENTQANIRWRRDNEDKLRTWLQAQA